MCPAEMWGKYKQADVHLQHCEEEFRLLSSLRDTSNVHAATMGGGGVGGSKNEDCISIFAVQRSKTELMKTVGQTAAGYPKLMTF